MRGVNEFQILLFMFYQLTRSLTPKALQSRSLFPFHNITWNHLIKRGEMMMAPLQFSDVLPHNMWHEKLNVHL
jgi:hypothetical protein